MYSFEKCVIQRENNTIHNTAQKASIPFYNQLLVLTENIKQRKEIGSLNLVLMWRKLEIEKFL
jgi:hypothetical protein